MTRFCVCLCLGLFGCGGSRFVGEDTRVDGAEQDARAGSNDGSSHDGGAVAQDSAPNVVLDAGSSTDSDVPPPVCLPDLSNVGAGDFSISFTLTTTETILSLGLLNQRVGCDDTSAFWDVHLGPTGGVTAYTNDGIHLVVVEAGNSLNDGKPHQVDIIRRDGMFWYASDGVISSTPTPDPYSFGAFPPLVIGSSACLGMTAIAGHATISDVCLTSSDRVP